MAPKKQLKEEYPLFIRIEKFDRQWLKVESRKKKWSIAKLVRSIIKYYQNKLDEK